MSVAGRRAAEAENRTEEVKAQAAHQMRQAAVLLDEFGRCAHVGDRGADIPESLHMSKFCHK